MKYSTNYIFFPENKALELAIGHAVGMLGEKSAEIAGLDNNVTVADNFLHTRGNFEQHRYSTNVLESAREVLEATLTEEFLDHAPLAWAATQNSLGNILAAQGQQQRSVGLFEKAILSFQNALEKFDREASPQEWASTQYNLGTATQALGTQQSDVKVLKTSVDAYTNALQEWTREQKPFEWALTMHQLGVTFHAYGKLLKGNRTFQKSVVAYKNALTELDADSSALELASTHNNQGAVLHNLSESEGNSERLQEAIRSYETALAVCMEQQLPIHLAVLCRVNMSTARGDLAGLTKDLAIAEETVDDFEVIIELFHDSLQPMCLTHCEEQMAKAQLLVQLLSDKG